MPKLPNGLTPLQQAFVPAYINAGFNATQAYLKLKPHVSLSTAHANGSDILNTAEVMDALSNRFDKQLDKSIASRDYLTQQAHNIGLKAESKELLGTALSAVELKGKLNRIFTEDVPDIENYQVLMQSLVVNINSKSSTSIPTKDSPSIPDVVVEADSDELPRE